MAKAKAPREPKRTLPEEVGKLALEIRLLHGHIDRLEKAWSRIIVPAEVMELLASELQALRHLLDPNGDFRAVDAMHAAYRTAKAQFQQAQEAALPRTDAV